MATVETIYLGELRTEATHVQSGSKILTDAPTDNHGKGEAFSPTDLVATALGSCMMTIMGIAAQTHGIDIDGTKLHITKIMSASPRRIGEISQNRSPIRNSARFSNGPRLPARSPSRCTRTANRPSATVTANNRRSTGARRRFVRPRAF